MPRGNLAHAWLSPQTRVFVQDEDTGRWVAGRVGSFDPEAGTFVVELPDGAYRTIPEGEVYVRAPDAATDPAAVLAVKGHETGFFHRERVALQRALVKHRARTHGLSGLASSRISVLPHQVSVVRRVLRDPVQRYLLADEVGLGKTIEAAVIGRQHLIDRPDGNVLIVAPPGLVGQWQEEWASRCALYHHDDRVRIVDWRAVPEAASPSLLVVDEAHHVAAGAWALSAEARALWERIDAVARCAGAVLLLSATPATTNADTFLAMLHLLDPSAYPLDARDTFAERVRVQEELGRVLLALDPSAPSFLLDAPAQRLLGLLPGDPELADRVESLVESLQDPEGSHAQETRRLRSWVSETYRLHERMLRTRREQAGVTPLGRSADGLREEWGMDTREAEVLDALEQWRLDAAAQGDAALADVHRVLMEVAGTDVALAGEVAQRRRSGEPPARDLSEADRRVLETPLWPGEAAALDVIAEAARRPLAPGDLDRAGLLAEALARPLRDGDQAVVFASYPSVARRLSERLAETLGPERVMTRLEGMPASALHEEVARFRSTLGAVMVCDRSGEEGVNLQRADHAVLYDVPFAPNRLEQRLGRVDRIGRETELTVWVLTGPEPRDEAPTVFEAWLEVLRDGFGLFRRSAAPLQFLVARETKRLVRVAFVGGAVALAQETEAVREAVAKEERRAAAEDLMRTMRSSDDAQSVVDDLEDDDAHAPDLSRAVGRWLGRVLQFDVERDDGGTVYRPSPRTLLPADAILNRFLALSTRPTTFVRDEALAPGGPELARAGHPIVEEVAASLRWDDRGCAAAYLRQVPAGGTVSQWAGYRLDWIVEADAGPATAVLEARGLATSAAVAVLRRRLDGLFAPQFATVLVDPDGSVVAEGDLREALLAPFDSTTDTNLHRHRVGRLDGYVSSASWSRSVKEAATAAEEWIRASDAVQRRAATGDARLARERAERIPVLRARQRHGRALEAEQALALEDELLNAFAEGIARPTVSLAAMAFVALDTPEDA